MTGHTSPGGIDAVVEESVDLLQRFELTEYEAKSFVALSRIATGTAKEVAEVADIPQARVYDCMETLRDRGLVDIQQSTPRRFRASGPDEAVATLDRQYTSHLDRLRELFPRLESPAREDESVDVWVMEGSTEVSERLRELVLAAEDEVLLALAVEELLTDQLLAALDEAAERGVSVVVGSPGEPIRDRVAATAATARVVETWTWWEAYPVRPGAVSAVLMVDGESMLVSADAASSLPGVSNHRAVWTDSERAPLVKMLRPLLARAVDPSGVDSFTSP
ncbi:TrmB family transcriptional regulator [Halapricum hydrolyticum]|uniref:TrmB family transcriptional regulator n=1 Tax=Halapricum hydrolyticum TaxID=2979991 RepID=A0AAE3IE45_9EURY|nr:helix-turn-helix domain-containing protein [Halapricum hydrolyticum]MCU4719540.1 TrmB family transcriptional regulator [Halapricum hydrolyticum]MCU4728517.1 TrmB family transcriptional regulator [Halapricum hydrolyticum]